MIKPLPYWVVPDSFPAFYETEGATAIQMVAKIYGKIQDLINDYNSFVDQVNLEIKNFEDGITADFECFRNNIIQTMNDYIETIDTKINLQDTKIAEAIEYMKDNILATATDLFTQAIANGDIRTDLRIQYNPTNERLDFSIESGER